MTAIRASIRGTKHRAALAALPDLLTVQRRCTLAIKLPVSIRIGEADRWIPVRAVKIDYGRLGLARRRP